VKKPVFTGFFYMYTYLKMR